MVRCPRALRWRRRREGFDAFGSLRGNLERKIRVSKKEESYDFLWKGQSTNLNIYNEFNALYRSF